MSLRNTPFHDLGNIIVHEQHIFEIVEQCISDGILSSRDPICLTTVKATNSLLSGCEFDEGAE